MSLRDYFAAAALMALSACDGSWPVHNAAKHAYALADAMLAHRRRLGPRDPSDLRSPTSDLRS